MYAAISWAKDYALKPGSRQEKLVAALLIIAAALPTLLIALFKMVPIEVLSTALAYDRSGIRLAWVQGVVTDVPGLGLRFLPAGETVSQEGFVFSVMIILLQTLFALAARAAGSWTQKGDTTFLGLIAGLLAKKLRPADLNPEKVAPILGMLAFMVIDTWSGAVYRYTPELGWFLTIVFAFFWENVASDMAVALGLTWLIIGVGALWSLLFGDLPQRKPALPAGGKPPGGKPGSGKPQDKGSSHPPLFFPTED